ncbi:MAG: DUF4214 domain-containing protein [Sulfurovum sp.]|nr:DUF4214 domain-containing protein [Sulfurovaceae bacterium]
MEITREEITQVYVSTFNRAPDAEGLEYWYNTGLAIEQIASSFFDQIETKEMYPTTMSNPVFVGAIYNNIFNHSPDNDGLEYWSGELDYKEISRSNMILAIGNGATGTDKNILDNKTKVGLYHAGRMLNDSDKSTDIMSGVDNTDESVSTAMDTINSLSTFDLTENKDKIIAGFLDDMMKGSALSINQTYTTGDSVDGGDGDDVLRLTLGVGGSDPMASIKNIETVELISLVPTENHTINIGNWVDIENLKIINTSAATLISNANYEFKSIFINGLYETAIQSVEVNDDIFDGTYDTVYITISEALPSAIARVGIANSDNEGVIEKYKIASKDNSGTILGDNVSGVSLSTVDNVSSVYIYGNSDIKLLTYGGLDITRVDASSLEAGLEYLSTGQGGTDILGGTKRDDIISLYANDTIDGGKGADSIELKAVTQTQQTLKYNNIGDSGKTTASADTIIGFETTIDKFSFEGLDAGDINNFYQSSSIASSVEAAMMTANSGELKGYTYGFYSNIGDSFLIIDGDGDGRADQAIILSGVTLFEAGDII